MAPVRRVPRGVAGGQRAAQQAGERTSADFIILVTLLRRMPIRNMMTKIGISTQSRIDGSSTRSSMALGQRAGGGFIPDRFARALNERRRTGRLVVEARRAALATDERLLATSRSLVPQRMREAELLWSDRET